MDSTRAAGEEGGVAIAVDIIRVIGRTSHTPGHGDGES